MDRGTWQAAVRGCKESDTTERMRTESHSLDVKKRRCSELGRRDKRRTAKLSSAGKKSGRRRLISRTVCRKDQNQLLI